MSDVTQPRPVLSWWLRIVYQPDDAEPQQLFVLSDAINEDKAREAAQAILEGEPGSPKVSGSITEVHILSTITRGTVRRVLRSEWS